MNVITFSLLVLCLISCNHNKQASNTKKLIVKEVCNAMESNSNQFCDYWELFQYSVLNRDLAELENLVHFPFEDFYNNIYDPDFSLSCKDINDLKNKFDSIFDECVIKAIKQKKIRGYDKNYGEFGDIIDASDFLLITNCPLREKDLLFKRFDGKYYLFGIQYYE